MTDPRVRKNGSTPKRPDNESTVDALADEVMAKYRKKRHLDLGSVKKLSEIMAAGEEEPAQYAARRFFSTIVEPLNDSFDDEDRDAYFKIFAHLLHSVRRLPEGGPLEERLKEFRLFTEADLLNRVKKLVAPVQAEIVDPREVKKVFVLSRVTIGADIAVTSIMIERLKRVFPAARIVFIADRKANELFGGDRRLDILPLAYGRRGDLISRLESWLFLLEVINKETEDMKPFQRVIVDPKSRVTQLGLLPLVQGDVGYYLFEPVAKAGRRVKKLGVDANEWLDRVFGATAGEHAYPCLHIPPRYIDAAAAFYRGLRLDNRLTVTVNFGVGGNPKKRVNRRFETGVILHLLGRGATVILDKGYGEEEVDRVEGIVEEIRSRGKNVLEVGDNLSCADRSDPHLVVYRGGIGPLAGLISQSTLYLGYDSMGQHLAAALGAAVLVIFNGHPSERFLQKWHPYGRGKIAVIDAGGKPWHRVLDQTAAYLDRTFP